MYSRDEYGNMEDYLDEYDGSYLAHYEKRIRGLIRVEDGDMYVIFRHGGDDWFMLNGDEFNEYLGNHKMGDTL